MPRPQRKRVIYQLPACREFVPGQRLPGMSEKGEEAVCLSLDELEALRLSDLEKLDQAQAALRLNVSRSTFQNILHGARAKTADALVNGRPLRICGGNIVYSDDAAFGCCRWTWESVPRTGGIADCVNGKEKEKNMRIAVTYDNADGEIFQHFGRTEHFKVYEVSDGKVTGSSVVSTNGQGHGALAGVLQGLHADVLICGGIGGGAQMALADAGIRLFGGCSGRADDAVQAFLAGNLSYQEDVRCEHHDHAHGEGGCGGGCHEHA